MRRPIGDAAAGDGDSPDFDLRHSVREDGVIQTVPIRLTFVGRTATLRSFLKRLLAGGPLVAVNAISAEPAPPSPSRRQGGQDGTEAVVLTVQPELTTFAVTVEYCALAPLPFELRAGARTAAAGVAGSAAAVWSEPTAQKRGRGWIFDLFTPPAVYRDRRSHAFAAVAAEAAMTPDPGNPVSGLQLLQVRQRPFRLRLVGFAGGADNLRGIFADTTTGRTVFGGAGDRLTGFELRIKQLGFGRAGASAGRTGGWLLTATVTDERTAEDIALTTCGPSPAGRPVGVFSSRKNPALRRELAEGETTVVDGARYCIERVELEPPIAVADWVPADGVTRGRQVLISQALPDLPGALPALTANESVNGKIPARP